MKKSRSDRRTAEEKLSRRLTGQFLNNLPAHDDRIPEVLARGFPEIGEVVGCGEVVAGADAVENLAGPVLMDLHLAKAGTVGNDVSRQEHARDEAAVAADEEIGDATLDIAQARQG